MGDNGDFRFPHEVRGWLSEAEGCVLAGLARGKCVLEIGSYEGRSTCCLVQTAASVDCIDPLDGRACGVPLNDTRDALVSNLKRYGRGARIYAGTTEEVAPDLAPGYDLVFIDGDHSAAALDVDVREALRLLAPGGVLAFHDYETGKDPAVSAAVHALLADGALLESVTDTLAVVRPPSVPRTGKPVVALAMPRRGNMVAFGASEGFHLAPSFGRCEVVRLWTCCSILDHAFNRLWAQALNMRDQGVTHFAMLHDDVCPCHGWLDLMLAEMNKARADVLSAVVPIKGPEGTTSTAVETDDVWLPRRLTMTERDALPTTFGDADVGGEILLNSGLMLIDLRRPFWTEPDVMFFQTVNRITTDADGRLQAQCRSEDWEFSRVARARGARLYATKAVRLTHAGEAEFPGEGTWGNWKTDEIHAARLAGREACTAPLPETSLTSP